jgi:hypothetical protein
LIRINVSQGAAGLTAPVLPHGARPAGARFERVDFARQASMHGPERSTRPGSVAAARARAGTTASHRPVGALAPRAGPRLTTCLTTCLTVWRARWSRGRGFTALLT